MGEILRGEPKSRLLNDPKQEIFFSKQEFGQGMNRGAFFWGCGQLQQGSGSNTARTPPTRGQHQADPKDHK
jgi:hypothetical protein